jgi:hypothetical protein
MMGAETFLRAVGFHAQTAVLAFAETGSPGPTGRCHTPRSLALTVSVKGPPSGAIGVFWFSQISRCSSGQ